MRIFYCPDIEKAQVLNEGESRHAIKVMRMNVGDQMTVLDGVGGAFECTITDAHHKACSFTVDREIENYSPATPSLHIAIAPVKNSDRFEWFLEKATEMGISEITPILCDHSERKKVNLERCERILISAMKQSGRAELPKLNDLTKLSDLLGTCSESVKMILISDGKVAADIQGVVSGDDNIKLTNSHDIAEVAQLITNF